MSIEAFPPNTFIIGFPKCATTALHRYLSVSDEVYAPVVKEPEYYSKGIFNESSATQYLSNYRAVAAHNRIILDSSASYVFGSESIPDMIWENSKNPENVKIIVVLRNPVKRFISFFNFLKHMNLVENEVDIEDFIDLQLANFTNTDTPSTEEFTISNPNYSSRALHAGMYHQHLIDWHSKFGKNMKVVSFEMLIQDTAGLMEDVGEFLDLSYDWKNCDFKKENETLSHKHRLLHKSAIKLYSKLYKTFNSHPVVKQKLLSIYKKLNTNKSKPVTNLESMEKLAAFYSEDIRNTQDFIRSIRVDESIVNSIWDT